MTLQKETVDQFILEMTLIDPIEKIISKLHNHEFRDCDIKWLDNKLECFIEFAAETLNLKISAHVKSESTGHIMNDYVRKSFIDKFTNLLNYFKNLIR